MEKQESTIRLLSELDENIGSLQTLEVIENVLKFITVNMNLHGASITFLKSENIGFTAGNISYCVKEMEFNGFFPLEDVQYYKLLTNKEPIYRPDIIKYQKSSKAKTRLIACGHLSDYTVPIIVDEACMGTICIVSSNADGISEFNRQILMHVAPKLAPALKIMQTDQKFREKGIKHMNQGVISHNVAIIPPSLQILKDSEEKLKILFETAPDGIYLHDLNGFFIDINNTAEILLGYSRDEVVGKTFNQLGILSKKDLARSIQNLKISNQGKSIGPEIFTLKRKSGDETQVEIRAHPITLKNKVLVLGIARDINDRKLAETALKLSVEQLEMIIDKIPGKIAYLNPKEEYLYVNQEYADTFGLTKRSFKGQSMKKMLPVSTYNLAKPNIRDVLKGKTLRYETVFDDDLHAGQVFYVNYIPHFNKIGKVIGFLSSIHDITDQKRSEQELKKINLELLISQKEAKESDCLKSAFLANISHEIRTPMNGIMGFSELLSDPELSTELHQEYIQMIKKSGQRLLNTVNDLIHIAQIESGNVSITLTEININEIIEYLVAYLKPLATIKGLSIFFNKTMTAKEASIFTDGDKLNAIITILINNAIKYSEKGVIEISCERKGKNLEISVNDQGIGIAKEMQEDIFKRFIQADTGMSRNYEGSGLGLSITRAYVKMLGGDIWVQSALGAGAKFTFTLPYNVSPNNKKPIIKKSLKDGFHHQIKKLNILIVEDDEDTIAYLTEMAKILVKNIFYVKTGVEAVNFCKNTANIDLILMDMRMPEMNGYEATMRIRKFNKEVIIIAQTSFAYPDNHARALSAGCNDFITKPVTKEALLATISKFF